MESGEDSELSPELLALSWIRWAGDGRSIFITGRDEKNRRGLYCLHLTTGALETVFLRKFFKPEPSSDGKVVFYLSDGTVFRHELATGRARPIEGPLEFITS